MAPCGRSRAPPRTGRVMICLVTGGGRGLGAAICHTLADAGMTIVVLDVRADLAEEVAAAVRAAGAKATARALDVTDAARAADVVRDVGDELGGVDVLVNNAGTDVTAPFDELSVADWDRSEEHTSELQSHSD